MNADDTRKGDTEMSEEITRWRLRPITVEAVRWTDDNPGEVYELTGCDNFDVLSEQDRANCDDPEATAAVFARLHGSTWKLVKPGQWIVKGAKGEFFPLPDELFRGAYDPADDDAPAVDAAPLLREIILDMARAIRRNMNGGGRIARSEVNDWTARAGVEFDIYAEDADQ